MSGEKSHRRGRNLNRTVTPREHDMRSAGPSFWVTKAGMDRILSSQDPSASVVATYIAMLWLQNNSGREEFFASAAQIGQHAGLGERTAEKNLRTLARLGLVGVRSGRNSGFHQANRYVIASTRSATATEQRSANSTEHVPQMNPESVADSKEPKPYGLGVLNAPTAPALAGAAPGLGAEDGKAPSMTDPFAPLQLPEGLK